MRDDGARDAVKAYASNIAKIQKCKLRGEALHKFELKFRTVKDRQETLSIHSKHWAHKRGVYSDLFGPGWCDMKSAEDLPSDLQYDSRLIRTRLGEYYLCVPMQLQPRGESQAPDPALDSVVSLDPGVRTFMTAYSTDGQVVEWGPGDATRISRLGAAFDKLSSKIKARGIVHRQRYKMKRAALRIQAKIRHIVDELHHKTAKWLCSNFRVVLIPVFKTQQMVTRGTDGKRRLGSKTARAMCSWSHHRFRMCLHAKARESPWCKVIDTTEEFTTKTCGGCGHIDKTIGSKKEYKCNSCGFEADRDHNGARNVLIRYMSLGN